jgi:ribosomal protein S18 acetylase RimI-like enzyme
MANPIAMLTVRRAAADDVPAMVAVVNAAFVVERGFRVGERTSLEGLTGAMTRNVFFVAELDRNIAGVVLTRVEGRTGYFGMLAVDPDRQRSGIGHALLNAVEEHCRCQGCTTMTCSTAGFRRELLDYYGRYGYRMTHTSLSPPEAPFSPPIDIVHLAKQL